MCITCHPHEMYRHLGFVAPTKENNPWIHGRPPDKATKAFIFIVVIKPVLINSR